jgi:hypothetical protein
MERFWKISGVIVLLAIFLCGCRSINVKEPAQPTLVNRIEILYNSHDVHLQRSYTATDKIDTILFFLYGLSPVGRVEEDPEQISEQRCKITAVLSNGETYIYRLRGGRYLSVNCKPWQKIDSQKADWLFTVLVSMPSDA